MDRERSTASPTAVTPSPSHHRTDTSDPPPPTSRRRLLPQPDRAAALERAASAARDKSAVLRRSASAVSSRYFVPISNHEDQQRESKTPSFRRLPLVVDTSDGRTLASLAAVSDRGVHDEAPKVTSVYENKTNNPACASDVEGGRDNFDVLPNVPTTTQPLGQNREHVTSTTSESLYVNHDEDRLLDLPEDEHGQQPTRLSFRSSTLPRRWKSHRPYSESPRLVDRQDCRELRTTQTETYKDLVHGGTEPLSSVLNYNSDATSTQSQATSAMARVEAMKQRFRRLSEMYKNTVEEDSVIVIPSSTKIQKNDVGDVGKNQQLAGDTENTGTEVGSNATSTWKTATTVTSDTESLSSCGRDEGFESETATSSVVYGTDGTSLDSHHSHNLTTDVIASTTAAKNDAATEATANVCAEANLFASSIDSIIQRTSSRSLDGHTIHSEATAADASSSSLIGTPSTDEVARSGVLHDHTSTTTSATTRLSRINQQRAFSERMSAPRRSVTRSPQRRTSASSSDATSRSGLYSSPMVRRKTRTPAANGPSPPPRDHTPLTTSVQHRLRSDAGEVDETTTSSRFVRGSFTRTTLPHSGISDRASANAKPTNSKDQKQPVPVTLPKTSSSSKHTHRSASKTQESQTIKAAGGLYHTPALMQVDRNGVQAKPSRVSRVFSTPVRFGPTSHQTRPARNIEAERQNAGDGNSGSVPSKQTDHTVSVDGHSQTAENGPQVTSDSRPTPRISERKSVFERLFQKSQQQRYSKPAANSVAAASVAQTGCREGQAAELYKKLSFKRP